MTRLYVKVVLVLTVLMAAVSFGIVFGLRPAPTKGLREFLLSTQDCLIPCFMHIQLSYTRRSEAISILEEHEWVNELTVSTDTPVLSWTWSGEQPAFIDSNTPGMINFPYDPEYVSEDPFVDSLVIRTFISAVDVYLILDEQPYVHSSLYLNHPFIQSYFFINNIRMLNEPECPVDDRNFLAGSVTLSFFSGRDFIGDLGIPADKGTLLSVC